MLSVDIQKKLRSFDLDMYFQSGAKMLGILGASGCGKSMTLKCIAGIERPDLGAICLFDTTLFSKKDKINLKPQSRNVGYLFQDYALFPNMSVRQNIECASKMRADEMIRRLGIDYEQSRPDTLSGGQKQKAALARALAHEPKMLLLDEPFSALDAYVRESISYETKNILEELNIPSVIVTHDRDEAYRLCDELIIMHEGAVIEQGKTKELFLNPKKLVTARVTGCKNIFPFEKVSKNEAYIPILGITLKTRDIKNEKYIGIRAHDFKKARANDENAFCVRDAKISEAPFEYNITLRCKNEGHIIWKLEKGFDPNTEYLSVSSEKILLLE